MTPFDCYKEYISLKNHFTRPDYDYFKYNGKSKASFDGFEKRKDKFFFQKLAKHSDVHNFLVANLSENEKAWIKELAYSEEAEKVYTNWLKRQQSITYMFKQDLNKLMDKFNENFFVSNNEHPFLLKQYLAKEISLETLCLLLSLSGAKKHWDKKMEYDLIWQSISAKVEKYSPFIKSDMDKLKKICLDYFTE
jgi:hypothetical protein